MKGIEEQIKEIRASPLEKSSTGNNQTIFHEVLNNPTLPESEKAPGRLWQDGYVTVVAGTLTTADALTWAVYGLLSQPHTLRELKAELNAAIPDPHTAPEMVTLENLPYLTAVIYEALRLSNGVSMRLSRIDPDKPMIYTNPSTNATYTIPPGTPVSMTGILIHLNSTYFPNPTQFNPERWLPHPPSHPSMKYLVPFTRGTRQCLGMNLAWAELYLTLGMMFRRYGSKEVKGEGDRGVLGLWEFEFGRDLEIVGDGALPLYGVGSRGVRVVVSES